MGFVPKPAVPETAPEIKADPEKLETFRAAVAAAKSQPVELRLPASGIKVKLRYLSPLANLMLDQELADLDTTTPEGLAEYARIMVALLAEIVVEPEISLKRGKGRLHPNRIAPEDSNFIFDFGRGNISPEGVRLRDLFREAGPAAAPGADRADEPLPAQLARGTDGHAGPADG